MNWAFQVKITRERLRSEPAFLSQHIISQLDKWESENGPVQGDDFLIRVLLGDMGAVGNPSVGSLVTFKEPLKFDLSDSELVGVVLEYEADGQANVAVPNRSIWVRPEELSVVNPADVALNVVMNLAEIRRQFDEQSSNDTRKQYD